MASAHPGFGPPPRWRLPATFGFIFTMFGVFAWLSGSRQHGMLLIASSAVPLLLGLARLGRFWADTRHLRHMAPSAGERTSIILQALGSTPADLAANAAAIITPAQWRRIQAQTGTMGLVNGPLPAVRAVEGPALLTTLQIRNWIWYDLTIGGVRFRSTTDTLVNAMLRHSAYRVYFADIPAPDLLRETARVVLSAEALPASD